MTLTMDLLHIVEQAHSLERILAAATPVIAERLRVDACSVFLLADHGDLVRSSAGRDSSGEGSKHADAEAESIAAQATAERRVVTNHGAATSLLASPMLLRDSVVGALVIQSTARREYSSGDIETLAAICAQLVGIIENARIIEALDRGERPRSRGLPRLPSKEATEGELVLSGVGASPGVAIGPAVFRGAYRLDLSARDLPTGDATVERERVRTAIRKSHNDVSRVQLAAAREIDDIDDLRTRLLDHVLGSASRAHLGTGVVLSSRIPPSLVIEMKTEGAQGLVTETGWCDLPRRAPGASAGHPHGHGDRRHAAVGAARRSAHRRWHDGRRGRAPQRSDRDPLRGGAPASRASEDRACEVPQRARPYGGRRARDHPMLRAIRGILAQSDARSVEAALRVVAQSPPGFVNQGSSITEAPDSS